MLFHCVDEIDANETAIATDKIVYLLVYIAAENWRRKEQSEHVQIIHAIKMFHQLTQCLFMNALGIMEWKQINITSFQTNGEQYEND